MGKRGSIHALAIVFFIFFAPGAFSIYSESVFSDTVEDGETAEIEGITFRFIVEHVSSKVYVVFGSSSVIVPSGECKVKDSYNICVSNISFSRKDLVKYREVYQAIVAISQIKAKLETSHTIAKQNLLLGEETTAQLDIENTADITSKGVVATIDIPENLLIKEANGCNKLPGKVFFSGDITPHLKKTCTYTIIGSKAGDFELAPKITFFDGVGTKNAESSAVAGKVYNHSLKISMPLNQTSYEIGDKLNLTLVVENENDEHNLDVTVLNLKLPKDFLIVKHPKGLSKTKDILSWSGHLAAKEKISFPIELQSHSVGNHTIKVDSVYKISKFLSETNQHLNVEYSCNCPYIEHEITPEIIGPGKTLRLKSFIFNPSESYEFSDVNIKYISTVPELPDFSNGYDRLSPLRRLPIINSEFPAPAIGEKYNINISAAFELNGQPFFAKRNIAIEPSLLSGSKKETENESTDESGQIEEETREKTSQILNPENKTGAKEETNSSKQVPLELQYTMNRPKTYLIFAFVGVLIFVAALTLFFILRKRRLSEAPRSIEAINRKFEEQKAKKPSKGVELEAPQLPTKETRPKTGHKAKKLKSKIKPKKEKSKLKKSKNIETLQEEISELDNVASKSKKIKKSNKK